MDRYEREGDRERAEADRHRGDYGGLNRGNAALVARVLPKEFPAREETGRGARCGCGGPIGLAWGTMCFDCDPDAL